jgi:hypothetical protein
MRWLSPIPRRLLSVIDTDLQGEKLRGRIGGRHHLIMTPDGNPDRSDVGGD